MCLLHESFRSSTDATDSRSVRTLTACDDSADKLRVDSPLIIPAGDAVSYDLRHKTPRYYVHVYVRTYVRRHDSVFLYIAMYTSLLCRAEECCRKKQRFPMRLRRIRMYVCMSTDVCTYESTCMSLCMRVSVRMHACMHALRCMCVMYLLRFLKESHAA